MPAPLIFGLPEISLSMVRSGKPHLTGAAPLAIAITAPDKSGGP